MLSEQCIQRTDSEHVVGSGRLVSDRQSAGQHFHFPFAHARPLRAGAHKTRLDHRRERAYPDGHIDFHWHAHTRVTPHPAPPRPTTPPPAPALPRPHPPPP